MKEKILYKYRTISPNTYHLLENSEFYFSFPHQFNDPFDCFITSDYHGDESDWKKFIDRVPGDSAAKKRAFDFAKSLNFDSTELKKYLKLKDRDNHNENMMVYCLTEICDSILMWAHYAGIHTGICLGFRTLIKDDKKFGFIPMDEVITDLEVPKNKYTPIWFVKYTDKFPTPYNGLKEPPKETMKFVKTKYECWSYENEWRSILQNEYGKQNLKFDKNILAEVIFGINIDPAEQQKITDIVTHIYIKQGIPVKLKKAKHSQTEYKIEFEDLN